MRQTPSSPLTLFFCALLSAGGLVHAQAGNDADAVAVAVADTTEQTGGFTATFTERSPLSTVHGITTRFRTELPNPPADYVIAEESFEVYVPPAYDGSEPFGLLVWINAGPRGEPPTDYLPILDQHKLIWVGANDSGNPRSFWHRAGLALDGLHNITRTYRIDPMRAYVSGVSGGGRSASRVGLVYADLFAGAFSLIGTDFFTRLPHPDSRELVMKFWAPAFNPPQPGVIRRAKRDGRYVLLTGETDGNRAQTLAAYLFGYQRANFEYVTYLEVPGMGHTLPPADWFARGIEALDGPLEAIRERRESEAGKDYDRALDRLDRSRKHGIEALQDLLLDYPDTTYAAKAEAALAAAAEVPDADETSSTHDDVKQTPPPDKAREKLALARNYLRAGKTDLARELLNQLVEYYPDSEEAEDARALLEGMTAQ